MRIEILDTSKAGFPSMGFGSTKSNPKASADYFVDSLMADIESLHLYAGVHPKHFGYYRMIARRFPYAIYYRLEERSDPRPCRSRLPKKSRLDSASD